LGPRPARRGRRISPIWIAIVIALIGSLALVIYAFLKRDASQIPLLATAATIFGIVLVVAAIGGAVATYRAARQGRAGRAVVLALAGGFAAILAAGVLAFATILGLLYHP
jgi:drug/metabolite transporter (DMT)-like permease